MHRKILGVVSVFLILLKVQLCQQLTGLHHRVVSVLQQTVGAINLWRQVQGNFVSAWCGGNEYKTISEHTEFDCVLGTYL